MSMQNKWGRPPNSKVVAYYHRRVGEIVEQKLRQSGRSWQDFVWNDEFALSEQDFQNIETELLDTGVRFEMSAQISIDEAPEKYLLPVDEKLPEGIETDEFGRHLAGDGDNVFQCNEDIVGTARFISNVDAVMEYLKNGVPEKTVAIIDDSGGTLTAPILENFSAVVCKGGSVRSHLGILTREYQIPCLMDAQVRGLKDGDEVQVEYSVAAKVPYQQDDKSRARVWKLGRG